MHRVNLQSAGYFATLGGAAANNFKIVQSIGGVETVLYSALSVSATGEVINFAGGSGQISAPIGADLIVALVDGTSLADAAANYLVVTGTIQ